MWILATLSGLGLGWAVAAAAAAAAPWCLHALSTRWATSVRFPAAVFLTYEAQNAGGRNRVRDLGAMLVRTGALAGGVLACAGLAWLAPPAQHTNDATVVVVLDASVSMTRTQGGVTRFAIAKAQAIRELQTAHADGAQVAAVIGDANPAVVVGYAQAINELRRAKATFEHASIAACLQAGAAARMEQHRPVRAVVCTDGQATAWEAGGEAGGEAGIGGGGIESVEIRVAGDDAAGANLAVVAVGVDANNSPRIGEQVQVTVSLRNGGDAVGAGVLRLLHQGRDVATQVQVRLAPGEERAVGMRATLARAGWAAIDARIDTVDRLGADNVYRVPVNPAQTLRVGVAGEEAAYLRAALDTAPFATVRVGPEPKETRDLGTLDALWVVGGLDRETRDAVAAANAGGLGVVWCAAPEQLDACGEFLRAIGEEGRVGLATLARDATVARGAFGDGLLGMLEGPAEAAIEEATVRDAAEIRTGNAWATLWDWRDANGASSGRRRAGALWRGGDARVVVVGSTLGASSGRGVARSWAFVPLVRELTAFVAGGGRVGTPGVVGRPIRIGTGGGEPPYTDSRARRVCAEADGTLLVPRLHEPGTVAVMDAGGATVGCAVANIDPRESDLTAVDLAAIEAALRDAGEKERKAKANAANADGATRGTQTQAVPAEGVGRKIDLAPWLFAIAGGMIALEPLVARRKKHRGDPHRTGDVL